MHCAAVIKLAALACALVLVTDGARSAPTNTDAGADTPDGAWDQARSAYSRGEFRAYIQSVSPDARDECICHITFYVAMAFDAGMLMSPRELNEMNAIMRRYGLADLPPKPTAAEGAQKPGLFKRQSIHLIVDKAGFYSEMMAYLRRHAVGPIVPADLAAALIDVRIDGAKATASREPPYGEIRFDKLGPSWFLHPPPACLNDLFRDEREH